MDFVTIGTALVIFAAAMGLGMFCKKADEWAAIQETLEDEK